MKEDDIKKFIPDDKFLQIGKKRFNVKFIISERTLKATAMFNRISQKGTEENKAITTDLDFYLSMLDVVFMLIKVDFSLMIEEFSFKNLADWIRRQLLTKKYILKHMDIKELSTFIDNALEPIIGTKKKELERENRMTDAMVILVETMTPEALAKLLENSLSTADIKKVM